MFKHNFKKIVFGAVLLTSVLISCKKEELLEPNETPAGADKTVIYIRAVDKDSSVVESEQILLR